MGAGLIIIILIFTFLGLVIGISGIVAAVKTEETEMNIGILLLHLFLWGGILAAIIYAVKTSNNAEKANASSPASQQTRFDKLLADSLITEEEHKKLSSEIIIDEEETLWAKLSRIDKLLEKGKLTETEHENLKKSFLEEEAIKQKK